MRHLVDPALCNCFLLGFLLSLLLGTRRVSVDSVVVNLSNSSLHSYGVTVFNLCPLCRSIGLIEFFPGSLHRTETCPGSRD